MASRSDQLEVPKEAHSSSSRSKRLYQNSLITLCVKGLCGHTLLRVVHASDLRLPCVARNSNFRRPRPGLHAGPTDVDDEIRFQSSCPNFVHAHSLYVHTNLTFHHFFPNERSMSLGPLSCLNSACARQFVTCYSLRGSLENIIPCARPNASAGRDIVSLQVPIYCGVGGSLEGHSRNLISWGIEMPTPNRPQAYFEMAEELIVSQVYR